MNVEILTEVFKNQLAAGLTIAPFLVAGNSVKDDEFGVAENIVDSSTKLVDDMTVEEKKKCMIVRLYADLTDLDTLVSILYDAEFVKMQDDEPIFRTSSNKMKIETLKEAFKDQLMAGLTVARYVVEHHHIKNGNEETRVLISIKQANLSNLENLSESLTDKTFLRMQNDLPVFGNACNRLENT